ncbi:MAG: hydroxymethylbilane synthase [Candidatus Omnitrophota bacterium]
MRLRVGTRPSPLALRQVEEIRSLLPRIIFDIVPIRTTGDKDKTTPLVLRENSDFFTREIEEALLSCEIDAAVHSAKDLEENAPGDLIVAAITKAVSRYDCLVSRGNLTLRELPPHARVATSSVNRRKALKEYRPDLVTEDIRGNIHQRLARVAQGDFDAVIVAHAAMLRLGLEASIAQVIPSAVIRPHPLQGRLAVQVRRDRKDLLEIFRGMHGE